MTTYTNYRQLCTEFYNSSKAWPSKSELEWYCSALYGLQGPILEAMCGSGRLLIPLLKHGFTVEGVDNSPSMLASCTQRMNEAGVMTTLYFQNVEHLVLPHTYDAIIVAVGSFQLITDPKKALTVLNNFYKYLNPGGFLLLDIYTPSDDDPETNTFVTCVDCPDSSQIKLTSYLTKNNQEHLYTSSSYYERIVNGEVIETEREELTIAWYTQTQLLNLLKQAGFSSIEQYPVTWAEQVTLYKAIKG